MEELEDILFEYVLLLVGLGINLHMAPGCCCFMVEPVVEVVVDFVEIFVEKLVVDKLALS